MKKSYHTIKLVLLDVRVVHSKTNTAFGDLHASDFDLSEDGVPQKIRGCPGRS